MCVEVPLCLCLFYNVWYLVDASVYALVKDEVD